MVVLGAKTKAGPTSGYGCVIRQPERKTAHFRVNEEEIDTMSEAR